jgi:hypothetical protein
MLNLKPEIAAGLQALANAQGLSVEEYIKQLVEKELSLADLETEKCEDDGMVWEDGLFVYRTGRPLPPHIIGNAVRHLREERMERILSDLS